MNLSNFNPVDLGRATDQQLNLVNSKFSGNAPDIWRDMAELNFVALRFCSIFDSLSDDDLAQMSVNLVHQLVSDFGGQQLYIPMGESNKKSARDGLIHKLFNGCNHRELAKKFRVSETRIRQIVDEKRGAHKKASAVPHAGTSGRRVGGPGTVVSPDEVHIL